MKPWLHKRFFACDGDEIFLRIVASLVCSGGYTWPQILRDPRRLGTNISGDKQHGKRRYCDFVRIYVLSIDKDKKKERGKREWSTWIRPWLARRSHK